MASQYLGDYKSLVNFVISLCVFVFVLMTKSYSNNTVNSLAGHSFMAYIVHQIPAFINVLWFDIAYSQVWRTSVWSPLIVIGVAILIYLVSSIADVAILKLIMMIQKNRKYGDIVKGVNGWYRRSFSPED